MRPILRCVDTLSRRANAVAASMAHRGRAVTVLDALGPVTLFALIAVSRQAEHFRLIVGEDGILEWTQVAAFAVAAWALCSAGAHAIGRRRLALLSCAALVLAVIGEELAWGTRLIGSGVELVEARNDQ